jgi:hypothetical protein
MRLLASADRARASSDCQHALRRENTPDAARNARRQAVPANRVRRKPQG